ncbi:hypothetical protein FHR81_005534 [Actinoalloteichus hoggarensis]|uniref:hypothetical protein n=1 Tax=Actinoalloteichus hoggarensis TaxID=1470176 RepID=UPI0012FE34C3|nr:hypothetical protein [Actinoalloteichus hoggarensis]MBB5924449.1 hypothetical protein [Actinoalloteichus hoggarensis]
MEGAILILFLSVHQPPLFAPPATLRAAAGRYPEGTDIGRTTDAQTPDREP